MPAPGGRRPAYERWRQRRIADYTARLADHVRARQPEAIVVPYHHVRDGWDYRAMAAAGDLIAPQVSNPVAVQRTGTYNEPVAGSDAVPGANQTFDPIRTPAVWRRESASETVRAMERNGTETYDIPAFLRRQAD